jgi:rubrerythrin
MAHMRYMIWADQADRDGFPNVARLFRAISFAEQAHATGHFRVLRDAPGAFEVLAGAGFGLGKTADNLAGAVAGEEFEIAEMYPTYLEVARLQGEPAAVRSMEYALAAEKIHAAMYRNAKQSVDQGRDAAIGRIQICGVCGHTLEGDAPDVCPVCGVKKPMFKAFA